MFNKCFVYTRCEADWKFFQEEGLLPTIENHYLLNACCALARYIFFDETATENFMNTSCISIRPFTWEYHIPTQIHHQCEKYYFLLVLNYQGHELLCELSQLWISHNQFRTLPVPPNLFYEDLIEARWKCSTKRIKSFIESCTHGGFLITWMTRISFKLAKVSGSL